MEETPLETAPAFAPNKRKINNRFIYLIVAVIAVALLFFGFKFISGGSTSTKIALKPTPTVTPILLPTDTPTPSVSQTPTPTDTPTPQDTPTAAPTQNPVDPTSGLDRSQLSVTVENGSGDSGVAGKGSSILKNLGYNVTATGNADNFNYTNVTIQVKAASSSYLNLLKSDLGSNYTVGNATSDLSDSFSTDALVIIGK